jgi:glycosyltransferase involved in cell wall biosynthesis
MEWLLLSGCYLLQDLLIARSLVENGFSVNVMCVKASEKPPHIENIKASGDYQGIHFEYTAGTTIRPNNFCMRRFIDFKGVVVALQRLINYKKSGRLSCIYYYGNIKSRSLYQWIFYLFSNSLRLPLVIELCERPWNFQRKHILDSFLHPLKSVDGVIVISSFLKEWVSKEKRRSKNLKILDLPILVDSGEYKSLEFRPDKRLYNIVFAASPGYRTTIEFIFDSMTLVWEKYSNARLVITGYREGVPETDWLRTQLDQRDISQKVTLAGYLPRPELLSLYQSASALLVPLFNDVRSKARFPTKIGEYLCSGRPIVTNNVGEIPKYFRDEENAFVCEPDNPNRYAYKIMDAIAPWNHELAEMVGKNGKDLAEKVFNYQSHEKSIVNFFSSICH